MGRASPAMGTDSRHMTKRRGVPAGDTCKRAPQGRKQARSPFAIRIGLPSIMFHYPSQHNNVCNLLGSDTVDPSVIRLSGSGCPVPDQMAPVPGTWHQAGTGAELVDIAAAQRTEGPGFPGTWCHRTWAHGRRKRARKLAPEHEGSAKILGTGHRRCLSARTAGQGRCRCVARWSRR